MLETRTGKQYLHEMTKQDHVELLETLLQHPGAVVLSGYQSELYDGMLKGWYKATTASFAEHGKKRVEVLWMNYDPPYQQLSLL